MAEPRRILLLSASAGAGHLRAAQALESACRLVYPTAEVRHVDTLELTPRPFRKLYGEKYLDFVNKAPELLGVLYDRTNRPPRNPAGDRLRLLGPRVARLLADPARLASRRRAALRLAHPTAALDVARELADLFP